jgi:CRP-like cAMP-binding protein
MSRGKQSALNEAAHWPVRFGKAQIIYDEGDPSEAIYRVEKGCVRLQVNGTDGSRQIIRFVFPGEIFGVCVERRNTAAEAVVDVELIRFSLKSVLELCTNSPTVAIELMDEATQAYRELAHHVERLAHLPASERVSWFIGLIQKRDISDDDHQLLEMLMSQKDIADYLGITPETLSRSLKFLQGRGDIPAGRLKKFLTLEKEFSI